MTTSRTVLWVKHVDTSSELTVKVCPTCRSFDQNGVVWRHNSGIPQESQSSQAQKSWRMIDAKASAWRMIHGNQVTFWRENTHRRSPPCFEQVRQNWRTWNQSSVCVTKHFFFARMCEGTISDIFVVDRSRLPLEPSDRKGVVFIRMKFWSIWVDFFPNLTRNSSIITRISSWGRISFRNILLFKIVSHAKSSTRPGLCSN